MDLLTTILAGTESSRLAQRLRDKERLVSTVTMSYSALMGGGIVSLRAELEAKDLERVERIILEEIARIQESGPTEEERRLAVTKFEAQHAFDTETSEGLAYAYGLAETTWTLDAELRLRGPAAAHHAASRSGTPRAGISRAPTTRGWPSCRSPGPDDAPARRSCWAGLARAARGRPRGPRAPRSAGRGCPTGSPCWCARTRPRPVVGISLMVRMGTRWETTDNAGISNLVQLMIVRGTTTRDGGQIVEAADAMGGSIEATGDVDYSEVAATALSRHWVEMLELVADVTLRPTMPDGVVGAVRDFLIRQVRNRGDKPYDVALDALTARVFGRHPYAWDPLGLKDSLERLDRNALLAHYKRHYVPGGLVLAVSGRVKTAEVMAQATRLFGPMPAGAAPTPRRRARPRPPRGARRAWCPARRRRS